MFVFACREGVGRQDTSLPYSSERGKLKQTFFGFRRQYNRKAPMKDGRAESAPPELFRQSGGVGPSSALNMQSGGQPDRLQTVGASSAHRCCGPWIDTRWEGLSRTGQTLVPTVLGNRRSAPLAERHEHVSETAVGFGR